MPSAARESLRLAGCEPERGEDQARQLRFIADWLWWLHALAAVRQAVGVAGATSLAIVGFPSPDILEDGLAAMIPTDGARPPTNAAPEPAPMHGVIGVRQGNRICNQTFKGAHRKPFSARFNADRLKASVAQVNNNAGLATILAHVWLGPGQPLRCGALGAALFMTTLPGLGEPLHVSIEDREQVELAAAVLASRVTRIVDAMANLPFRPAPRC